MSRAGEMSRGDYLCAFGVVIIWGLNFVVMKVGLQGLSPMLLGALRFALASLPFLLFVPRPRLPWRFLAVYGLVQGLGQFGLLFLAIDLGMPAGMASVVMQTQAFFTMLLAVPLLGERVRHDQWLGLSVAAVGLILVAASASSSGGQGSMTLIGLVLTVGAALMWAASNLVLRFAARATSDYDPFALIVWSSAVPMLPFLALAVLTDGWAATQETLTSIGLAEGLATAYLALFATLLAYTMWARLLRRHPTARVAPFSLLVPVVGLWAAAMAFDEHLTAVQWWGTVAVWGGLLINQFGARLFDRLRRWT